MPDVSSGDEFRELPISALDPHPLNPRGAVNTHEPNFLDLVESVREQGIQQPLIVAPKANNRFRIVMGHRRNEAARAAGLQFVPCIIRAFKTRETEEDVMLIENIQRKDLTPMQEARAIKRRYFALEKDVHATARALGLTQSFITQRLRLLKLDTSIQQMVDERKIGLSQAILISTLDSKQQKEILPRAVRAKAKDLKELVHNLKNGIKPPPRWKKKKKRVTSPEESFTRSWALTELKKVGETYFPAQYFRDAFDDVCQDACVETDDESMCISCPVPRLIAAMLRHRERRENAE